MAAHASDKGDSLNRRLRGGKWNTMVMMFVGGVVLMLDGFLVLFLPYEIYGAGVFVPARILIGVKMLRTTSCQISFVFLYIKSCPPDKLQTAFRFVIQFCSGIQYLICQGGMF